MALESRELRLSVSLGASFPPLWGGKHHQLEGLQLIHQVSTHMGRMCRPESLLPPELFQMICKGEKNFSAPSPESTLMSLLASPVFSCWPDQKHRGWYQLC